jgi:CheY-like chemotaxis protein
MRPTLLVVDDNPDIRDTLAIALSNHGFRVTGAANGKAALELLEAGLRPEMIILDLNMPEMSGWELLDVLAARPDLSGIEVLVLSSTAVEGRHHLGKHSSLEVLIATVEATLQRAA